MVAAPARPPPPSKAASASAAEADAPTLQFEDFSSIEMLNIFTTAGADATWCDHRSRGAGVDKAARLLVVFSICNLPPRDQIDLDKLIRQGA